MKKIIFLVVTVLSMSTLFAQGKAPLEFKEAKHNSGKVKQGVPVTYAFSFKNNSTTPVIIENATADCGCTTPIFPKGVVAKGATNQIKVTYNAANMGSFTKNITVNVAKFKEPIILTIVGEVVDAASASAKRQ